MADISPGWIAAGCSVIGLLSAAAGVKAGIYASGRDHGELKRQVADHERRLDTQGKAIEKLREEASALGNAVAGLTATCDRILAELGEARKDVRGLSSRLDAFVHRRGP